MVNGNKGKDFPQLSNHLKRFLLEKFGEKCCLCGWNKLHPVTNKVPLEVNHINGDSLNNSESNLQLLCPNCHYFNNKFSQSEQRQRTRSSKKDFEILIY